MAPNGLFQLAACAALLGASCASTGGIDAARRAHALYPPDKAERRDGRCERVVAIQRGETLSDIAEYCDVPLGALISYNLQIRNPDFVPPGELVQIPDVRGDLYSERVPIFEPIDYGPPPNEPLVAPPPPYAPLARGVERRRPSLIDFFKPRSPPAGTRPPGLSSIVGVLTNEGVRCPTLRDDRGRLFTLLGDLRGYRDGDRVLVQGSIAADDRICGQAEALAIAAIDSAPW